VTNERSISKHFSVPSLVRFSSFPLSHHISSSSASAVRNSSGMLHPEKSYITLDTFSQIGVGELVPSGRQTLTEAGSIPVFYGAGLASGIVRY
jgi:hypothetical protein